jgi:hypothetical protein
LAHLALLDALEERTSTWENNETGHTGYNMEPKKLTLVLIAALMFALPACTRSA